MFFAYSLLFTVGVAVIAPFYLWRYRGTPHVLRAFRERLGRLPPNCRQTKPGCIWIHAVSVGETLAVRTLVKKLQARFPNRMIFMSHVTPTGRAAGEARLAGIAGRFYAPLDWNFAAERVFDTLKPALLLIAETELWPNLIRAAHRRGVVVALANARLSDRSLNGYRLVRPFMRRVLESVDGVCAQSAEDAKRFLALGARRESVFETGNLKFDLESAAPGEFSVALDQALSQLYRRPVLIAASTMQGEEAMVLKAWRAVRREHPQALLILAPRHPARFNTVMEIMQAQGESGVRRSSLPAAESALAAELGSSRVLLLDTIGELAGIFRLADLVFMGGTLVPTGGHNILEPAYWGKPILFGPHMENFREIEELFLAAQAAVQVIDEEALSVQMLQLLADAPRRKSLGESARKVLEKHSGATARIVETVAGLLNDQEMARRIASGGIKR
jgi:3-deoxy-D-manno-octulosonic-acid transferase